MRALKTISKLLMVSGVVVAFSPLLAFGVAALYLLMTPPVSIDVEVEALAAYGAMFFVLGLIIFLVGLLGFACGGPGESKLGRRWFP